MLPHLETHHCTFLLLALKELYQLLKELSDQTNANAWRLTGTFNFGYKNLTNYR